MRYLLLLLLLTTPLIADPWGKDADLAYPQHPHPHPKEKGPLVFVGEALIDFHQEVISPADGPRSHFVPSSSQYTLESMRKYGFFRGFTMGCDRLMRENNEDWVYGTTIDNFGDVIKYNPVP